MSLRTKWLQLLVKVLSTSGSMREFKRNIMTSNYFLALHLLKSENHLSFVFFFSRSCAGQGCKRSFHLSCVDPPLSYFPPGPWHCYWCVRRKLKLGVHSVSEGVDSLLDVRECNFGNEGASYLQILIACLDYVLHKLCDIQLSHCTLLM